MSISLLGGFFILGLLGHALTRKEESHLHPGNGHVMPQADPARRRLQSAEDDDEPSMWPSRPLFGSNGGLFSHFDDDADFGTRFNPATGLPMVGCIDIGGSFYGFSASWSGSDIGSSFSSFGSDSMFSSDVGSSLSSFGSSSLFD
jgi:hypothetical protein